jgi:hypothetical protein
MLSLCFFHKKNRIEIHARLRFSEPIENFKPIQYACEPLQTATLALTFIFIFVHYITESFAEEVTGSLLE